MGKSASEAGDEKVVDRRKGWPAVVVGGSGRFGGFLVLGGVLLASAFTTRAALKRRQQPNKEPKANSGGEVGSKDAGAPATCCDRSSDCPSNTEKAEATGEIVTPCYLMDLLPDAPLENPTPLAASASAYILSQPPASTKDHMMVDLTHTDGTRSGVCRLDDVETRASPRPRVSVTEEEQKPEQEPILQDAEDSRVLFPMEPRNSNYCRAKGTANVVLTESIAAEVDGTNILHVEDEARQCQASDKDDENANLVVCGHEEGAGAKVDSTERLLSPKEKLSEDRPTQAYDEDEAKVERYDEEHRGAATISELQSSEIPMLVTSSEDQKCIDTTIVDDESHISEFLDEALPDNRHKEEINQEDGDANENILSTVENKDRNETELPSQDSDKSENFNSGENQNITSEDVPSNDYHISQTFGMNVREIEAFKPKDKVLHGEKLLVEPGIEAEADKPQVEHEEKEPLPLDFQDSEPFTSTKHQNGSSCLAPKSIVCDPHGQDIDQHEYLIIQDRHLYEERSAEELTAEDVGIVDESAVVVVAEIGPPSQHSKYQTSVTSLEVDDNLSCIKEYELGSLSNKTSRDVDQLGDPLPQDAVPQEWVTQGAEDKICRIDDHGAIKEQFLIENVSDSSPGDSTGSNTEASWPTDETDSYSSSHEYEMESQSDITKNQTKTQKDAPNQQKMVLYHQQETRFPATKMVMAKGKIGLPMKHARLSSLQILYPLLGLMLILLIVWSHNPMF